VLFEYKVLWRIFGPKRQEVTGGWRKLDNEEIRNLCSSTNIVKAMKPRETKLVNVLRGEEMREIENISRESSREGTTWMTLSYVGR
jgi:hypothetical protein